MQEIGDGNQRKMQIRMIDRTLKRPANRQSGRSSRIARAAAMRLRSWL